MSKALFASEQILITPKCLLSDQFEFKTLAKDQRLKLIETRELTKLQSLTLKKPRACGGFMNVTTAWRSALLQNQKDPQAFLYHYLRERSLSDLTHRHKIQYMSEIETLFEKLDSHYLKRQLTKLTAFPDRHAQSKAGVDAAKWLQGTLTDLIKEANYKEANVFSLKTVGAKQPSVVLKIGPPLSKDAVVIGAPMDTLPRQKELKYVANDDATGAATLLQVAQVLLKGEFNFKKPIYLIWYAAEKEGKLGSQSVVAWFNKEGIQVDAVLQLDMTGYVGKRKRGIGLTDDLTDAALTAYIADLINKYVKKEAGIVQCGYACSDHVSWYQNGNRVAYPFETMDDIGNPYLNTPHDTLDNLSLSHMLDFAKLATAFAVELAEPINVALMEAAPPSRF